MVKIIWTGSAIKDLEEIGEYIATSFPHFLQIPSETLDFIQFYFQTGC